MEEIILNVNWMAVIVGAILAYILGAIWYSQNVFGKTWMRGSNLNQSDKGDMVKPMIAQAVGTFLFAWVIGLTVLNNSLLLAVLITLTIASLIKSNGLFAKKNMTAVAIDSTFIIAMAVVMVAVHSFL